jgi:hypothetical protein
VATDRLAIQLLGDFHVSVGPRTIAGREWTLRKAKALAKLLALALQPWAVSSALCHADKGHVKLNRAAASAETPRQRGQSERTALT